MPGTVQEVLIDPDGFFEGRASEPRLLPPIGVVVAYGVLNIVADLPIVLLFDAKLTLVLLYGLLTLFLLHGFVWSVSWLTFAVVFQALSYLFGGDGSFRRTFTLIGWGFLPLFAGEFLMIIATIIAVQGAPPISLQSPEQMATAAQQIRSGPDILIASLVSTALYVWSCYIWVFALKHARKISTRQAIVSVAVPVMLAGTVNLL